MASSGTTVRIQDLPFNKNVPPLVINDRLVQKFQRTLKQTEINVFKQNPNDWRCQYMWDGCKKLRQLCISSTQSRTAYARTIGINMPINSPPDDAIMAFWQPDQLNRIWVLPASKCNWENYNPKTWHAVMYSSVHHHSFSDAPVIKPMPVEVDPIVPTNPPRPSDTQQPPDQPDHPMPDPRPPTPPDENMSAPDPPHQPDQSDRPDHPIPPAPPGVSPDSPVDPPLPPRDKPGGGTSAVKVNILTSPEAENDDEELELPNLAQEETTAPPAQSSSSKKQKTGKKKKPGENPDEDSPGPSPKNEPAASQSSQLADAIRQ